MRAVAYATRSRSKNRGDGDDGDGGDGGRDRALKEIICGIIYSAERGNPEIPFRAGRNFRGGGNA